MKNKKSVVGIIMGSDSDFGVMKQSGEILKEFGIEYEFMITSAHRTPDMMASYSKDAYKRGLKIIIAGAGGSAHLPGMAAAFANIPVIGVPIETKALKGLDSLLSIVQMPYGVPVATVAINNAKNAGLLAVEMLAISDKKLMTKYIKFKNRIKKESEEKNKNLS
ncbi:MAG TPA: 5-(carboxyamino)imidazole ribonucleotide mutase [Ignavibacteria bacterium]|nr:5-(carboxyamino)imidazole ribonucleotide mutase [Ignavibacteria bacterium]